MMDNSRAGRFIPALSFAWVAWSQSSPSDWTRWLELAWRVLLSLFGQAPLCAMVT